MPREKRLPIHNPRATSQRDSTPTPPVALVPASANTPRAITAPTHTELRQFDFNRSVLQILRMIRPHVASQQSVNSFLDFLYDPAAHHGHPRHPEWMQSTPEWVSNAVSRIRAEFRRRVEYRIYFNSYRSDDDLERASLSRLQSPYRFRSNAKFTKRTGLAMKTLVVHRNREIIVLCRKDYMIRRHGEFRLLRRNWSQTRRNDRSSAKFKKACWNAEFKAMFLRRPKWVDEAGKDISEKRIVAWATVTWASGLHGCASLTGAYNDLNSDLVRRRASI
jgi:hypothetical protein